MIEHTRAPRRHALGTVLAGFAAGFVAALVFNQIALAILNVVGVTPAMPYVLRPVPPFGVPAVLSLAFWGGIWGSVLAFLQRGFPRGAGYWIAALLFGAVVPTLVAWFVVAPLKGLPVAAGWDPARMAVGPIINAAWSVGTVLLLPLMSRWLAAGPPAR